jgi:predicted nucleotidyltransferase
VNLDLLVDVVERLVPLLDEIVLVGACAPGLLVTDPGASSVRRTFDVDVIAEIISYSGLVAFSERLTKLGLSLDTSEGAPACRWVCGESKLDVMPLEESLLGFSNRWYRQAMETATKTELPSGRTIWVITSPYFVATKLDAFYGRGKGDFLSSHDLEDVITVMDGRPSLREEIGTAAPEVREYIGNQCAGLLANSRFYDALPGYVLPDESSQRRIPALLSLIKELGHLE